MVYVWLIGHARGLLGAVHPIWLHPPVYGDVPDGGLLGLGQQRVGIAR